MRAADRNQMTLAALPRAWLCAAAVAGLIAAVIPTASAQPSTAPWGSQLKAAGATTSNGSSACWTGVQKQLAKAEQQDIANQTKAAQNNYSFLPAGQTFEQLSCLSNVLGGNLQILFGPPSLGSLLNGLADKACSVGQQYEQQAIAPIAQGLQTGLPSYQIAPGISTGALSGGVYVTPSAGGGIGGSSASVNITPIFDGNGYQAQAKPYFSGLFGGKP